MPSKILASLAGAISLFILAGCDNTYTPGAHHYSDDSSTGSRLSGTDTGLSTSGAADPSISNNAGGSGSYGGAGGH